MKIYIYKIPLGASRGDSRPKGHQGGTSSAALNRSIKIKAWVNHLELNEALLISMHLQADECGALIGSFLAFFFAS